jgi:hypothetical protein
MSSVQGFEEGVNNSWRLHDVHDNQALHAGYLVHDLDWTAARYIALGTEMHLGEIWVKVLHLYCLAHQS